MRGGASPPRLEMAVDLQTYLTTAREVLPVFTSGLERTSLVRSGLSLLHFKLLGLSEPQDFLTLDTGTLSKISSCLQDLLRQLDLLIDGDVQDKAKYFRSVLQDLIASQSDDGHYLIKELTVEAGCVAKKIHKTQYDKQKHQKPYYRHGNLEAIQYLLSFRSLLESGDVAIHSEYGKTLSQVTSGSLVNLTRALEMEAKILETCDILQLAIDTALPESAVGIESLIMAEDPTDDQTEDVMEIVDAANTACDHLQQVYELLSNQLHDCKPPKHIAKLHLSGLGGGRIGFLLSKCNGAQGWHPVPCRVQHEEPSMPPFRGCIDFRLAEARKKCLTLNFGKARAIFTESVPESSELAQQHGFVPEKLLTLKEVLGGNGLANTARSSRETWSTRWFLDSWLTKFSAPEQEPNDRRLNYKEALMENVVTVQYLLSESVFHLYCSPWLLDVWQPDLIEFPKSGTLLDFKRPYYPSPLSVELLEESQRALLDPSDYSETYSETFMAKFGLLLLQLQLQKIFPLEEEDRNNDLWPSIALCRYYDQFKDLVEPIKEVVVACLDFRDLLFQDLDSRGRSAAFKFRTVFYKKILVPLRDMLLLNYPKVAIELQNSSALSTPQSREKKSLMGCNSAAPSRSPEACSGTVGKTMLTRAGPDGDTEDFIARMTTFVTESIVPLPDELAQDIKHDRQKRNIRIAVLDTGIHIDGEDDFLIAAQTRILLKKNFLGNDEMAYDDTYGHGTHIVRLLLQHTPFAEIIVAKIAESKMLTRVEHIIDALNWVRTPECDADIIVMSFGLGQVTNPGMAEIIKILVAEHKLVFAAASNGGGNEPRAFPAKADGVFCIHVSDGKGNKTGINPPPWPNDYNFSTLGNVVQSEWNGKEVYLSGSSFAAPFAASIAANALEFIRHTLTEEYDDPNYFYRYQGMCSLFRCLSDRVDGYDYVKPWKMHLWDEGTRLPKTREALREIARLGPDMWIKRTSEQSFEGYPSDIDE
ncbi:subtilase family domain-containing protein [Cordyceps javanica]|uniref:Subtilase family domain-containing protein n=1 Tax=Cordyceps javanica TaxID=43265 RepID=A0A545W866_9HYPO|nr:subtilase family domain-containing protein [Cordyceps javanica]TQW10194.1 subtilase family domain-containing protein [Cordyceps javanica]